MAETETTDGDEQFSDAEQERRIAAGLSHDYPHDFPIRAVVEDVIRALRFGGAFAVIPPLHDRSEGRLVLIPEGDTTLRRAFGTATVSTEQLFADSDRTDGPAPLGVTDPASVYAQEVEITTLRGTTATHRLSWVSLDAASGSR